MFKLDNDMIRDIDKLILVECDNDLENITDNMVMDCIEIICEDNESLMKYNREELYQIYIDSISQEVHLYNKFVYFNLNLV